MYNRFDQIALPALIKAIQQSAMQLGDKAFTKKQTSGRLSRIKTELNEMRRSAVERLLKLDRGSPSFFPDGVFVARKRRVAVMQDIDDFTPVVAEPEKFGIVRGRDLTTVLVQFEGEEFAVKVEPHDLKIRFIR